MSNSQDFKSSKHCLNLILSNEKKNKQGFLYYKKLAETLPKYSKQFIS